jgi:hypothetical protein
MKGVAVAIRDDDDEKVIVWYRVWVAAHVRRRHRHGDGDDAQAHRHAEQNWRGRRVALAAR